jgi:xanthine dehydrogenase accessory factor
MAVSADASRFIGSVSSGCLDAEVIELGAAVLRSGETKHLRFGPEGQPPWRDVLTCGGVVDIRVEPWWGCSSSAVTRAIGPVLRGWLERDEAGVVISSDTQHLALDLEGRPTGHDVFNTPIRDLALDRLKRELPSLALETPAGAVFVRTLLPRPKLILIGAVDLAVPLVSMARAAGFSVTLVDPRRAYANAERFPVAPDRLLQAWPQTVVGDLRLGARDAAVVLTHDPKIDDPALLALLGTPVGYIGALGSSRSHASRLGRLMPLTDRPETLARIHGPAGMHLGTSDAAGIALGILAGIAKWRAEDERVRAAIAVL